MISFVFLRRGAYFSPRNDWILALEYQTDVQNLFRNKRYLIGIQLGQGGGKCSVFSNPVHP
jgi:hypothetical protein